MSGQPGGECVAPPPMEWHPYYQGMTWLLGWLERHGPFADMDVIRIPRPTRPAAAFVRPDELFPTEPSPEPIVMTRRRARGRAPYVGRPFHYEWHVGEDRLRRYIASDTRIVYDEEWRP